ncbi:WD40-repeat-containing domain protein [Rhizoctonia solani]|nr:WD40-repeat-containing domain protein [Rhizoctonia solani]
MIRVWDIERRMTIVGPLKGHSGAVTWAEYSPDNSQIVSCSHDCTLRLWDSRSRKMIGPPYEGHTDMVFSVAFSPKGTYVVSGSRDETVRIWDIRTGCQVDQPYEEHSQQVNSVAFSLCGQYVASGSRDCKIVIRRVVSDYLDDHSEPLARAPYGDRGYLPQTETIRIIAPEVMFNCLIGAGCVDLSSEMDAKEDTARIVSGGDFGDIWMGKLHNGTKVAIEAWRTNAFEQSNYKTLKRAARELFYWSRMEYSNIHHLKGVTS